MSVRFKRFVDFSRVAEVAVRTSHVFRFARERAEQFPGGTPVKSALFSEDWIGFGMACMYEGLMKGTPIEARAFRDRAKAANWLDVPAEVLRLEDTPKSPALGAVYPGRWRFSRALPIEEQRPVVPDHNDLCVATQISINVERRAIRLKTKSSLDFRSSSRTCNASTSARTD